MKNFSNTIIVDVDGTVADLMPAWINRYNNDYQDSLVPDQLISWDVDGYVKPECGKKIFDYLSDKTLYDNVLPITGALTGINALRELGYRVVFGTACNMNMGGRKLQWLADHHFLTLLHGTLSYDYIEINDKSLLSGSAFAIIDDAPKNLRGFEQPILFRQPHNHAGNPNQPATFHAADWPDVLRYLSAPRVTPSWGITHLNPTP